MSNAITVMHMRATHESIAMLLHVMFIYIYIICTSIAYGQAPESYRPSLAASDICASEEGSIPQHA